MRPGPFICASIRVLSLTVVSVTAFLLNPYWIDDNGDQMLYHSIDASFTELQVYRKLKIAPVWETCAAQGLLTLLMKGCSESSASSESAHQCILVSCDPRGIVFCFSFKLWPVYQTVKSSFNVQKYEHIAYIHNIQAFLLKFWQKYNFLIGRRCWKWMGKD